ncbi:hypothetical protein [Pseudoflavonifractor capillosus]|uniref:Uncharacterized protein n=1 Tax=Pseudoflavonifractor capillosus TaxID=106588 RepID=A0A921SSV4_9FIRM|nr:hypothetical protein [Pseudoflavonifractor capillosus]HJG87245.1 hypothetical protein [Pseudoflavonifractor capillosus]
MKREHRLYNVIFPIWMLVLFPQVWLIVIPGNLLVDCLLLLLTLLALKHRDKGGVVKQLWWKFWLLGFAADAIGVAWMLLGWLLAVPFGSWWESSVGHIMHNAFAHPAAFLWTLAGVAIAGVCIYFFDKKAMGRCDLLTAREKHIIALAMALVTAPWLFFIPMY